jgi:hypothetical protein
MKTIAIAGLVCLTFNVYAGSVHEAVRKIEIERNAKCVETSRSLFSKCFGSPKTCYYSIKYKCISNQNDFRLKVKVRDNASGSIVRVKVIN